MAGVLLMPLRAGGEALPLSTVSLRPVSVSLEVRAESGGDAQSFFATPGVSAASVSGVLSVGGTFIGQFDGDLSVAADHILLDVSGASIQTDAASDLRFLGTVIYEIDVPDLGGAMTPVFCDAVEVLSVLGVWQKQSDLLGGSLWSASLGDVFAGQQLACSTEFGFLANLPARDTMRVTAQMNYAVSLQVGQTGAFLETLRYDLLTFPPAIGMGDLNGDSLVDQVDVTILRRTLAGLPVN